MCKVKGEGKLSRFTLSCGLPKSSKLKKNSAKLRESKSGAKTLEKNTEQTYFDGKMHLRVGKYFADKEKKRRNV